MNAIISSPRISVAQIGPSPARRGGMAAVLRSMLASPLAERYRMRMITTYRSPQPVVRMVTFLLACGKIVAWCLRCGPRIAHVHSAIRGSIYRKSVCVFLVRLLRRPVLLHFHAGAGDIEEFDARIGSIRRWMVHRALWSATRVLAVSDETARTLERCFSYEGIMVVPNAAPPVSDVSRAAQSEASERSVLYLGGFANPVKGGDVLVAALARLVRQFPDVSFVLAGPGVPPDRLIELISGHPNISWKGWLDETAKLEQLAAADVFVLPSLSEGLPMALLEAMAYGCAVVASRVGGIPEAVAHEREAMIVPARDSGALEVSIGTLLHDAELRHNLGQRAQARASSLNENDVYGRLDSLYRELVCG